jgi:1,4-alpha-glucan branching enzyme
MYAKDNEWAGFDWLDFTDHNASVISFLRKAPDAPPVLWAFNFTPVPRHDYAVPCPREGRWTEVLNTDASHYGGSNLGNGGGAVARIDNGGPSLRLTLPPLAALAFVYQG